ncbi:MAG: ankyrin repeat domain-containing protein [Candidatus Aminicenantes bacterium]|nr:ankyrin repeat domain-containing protein [Candidatus Aminicenantes bacterium]
MEFKKLVLLVIVLFFLFVFSASAADIHDAVLKGDLSQVKKIVSSSPDQAHAKLENGKTPLHVAAEKGHRDIVIYLIDQKSDINAQDQLGNTPLLSAVFQRQKETAKILLEKGADVNIKNKENMPVIVAAMFTGLPDMIEPILDNGQDVNERFQTGITLLHAATALGNKEMVELLLSRGADIEATMENGVTPLYFAVSMGKSESVNLLVSRGASTGFIEKNTRRTYLHLAALKGIKKMVEIFLHNGLDVNAKDYKNKTPVEYAAKYGHKNITDHLISYGSSAEGIEKNYGISPYLKKNVRNGDAVVWYLGGAGWAIKTKNKFLVFDYAPMGSGPDEPLLANGNINPEEIKGQHVYVFVTHAHNDHFNPSIFKWKDSLKNITFILGFEAKNAPDHTAIKPRERKKIDDMEIITIKSTDEGVGFIVSVDGLVLFHAGDHANKAEDVNGPFRIEIDYLAGLGIKPDMIFMPITGCGFQDEGTIKKGIVYTLDHLKPGAFFPMHAGGHEYMYEEFVKKDGVTRSGTNYHCARNSGDSFFYNGKNK